MDSDNLEILSPEELRETGAFLPEVDGFVIWSKFAECDYCHQKLTNHFVILQKVARSGLTLMCLECAAKTFTFSSTPAS